MLRQVQDDRICQANLFPAEPTADTSTQEIVGAAGAGEDHPEGIVMQFLVAGGAPILHNPWNDPAGITPNVGRVRSLVEHGPQPA